MPLDRLYSTSDKLPQLSDQVGNGARANFKLALAEPALPANLLASIEALSSEEKEIVVEQFGVLSSSDKVRLLKRSMGLNRLSEQTEFNDALPEFSDIQSFIVIWDLQISETEKKELLKKFGLVTEITPISTRRMIDEIRIAPSASSEEFPGILTNTPEIRSIEENTTIRLK